MQVRWRATAVDAEVTHANPTPTRLTRDEIRDIYHSPLLGLVFRAAGVHRLHHDPNKIQLCTLMNIKCQLHAPVQCP